jgi:hypothetical protein
MTTMTINASKFCSVPECARIAGLTAGRVRQLLRSGKLHGVKISENAWIVERKDAEHLATETHAVGRPRSGRKNSA